MKIFEQYKGLRKELYVLFIGRIMTNMGAMIWPMFTLILNQKLGLSASQIATYMLLFSAVAIPMNLIGGKLADKYNKKNIIVICDFISVLSYIYCFIVPVTIQSIFIFVIAALFQSIEGPSYEALVADFTTSEDRERAYSLSYLGNNLGLVLSPTIAGILFNEHLNLCFLISGCSILFSTILILILIKDTHREVSVGATSVYEKELEKDVSVFSFLKSCRVITSCIILAVIYYSVYNMWSFLMPMDMAVAHGDKGSVLYGTITSVNCIQVVLFTPFITNLLKKKKPLTKMNYGVFLIIAGYAIFMFLKGMVSMCFASIIAFTFGEIVYTISEPAFLSRRIPASHRGRINSIKSCLCSVFGALIQKGIGIVYDKYQSTVTWFVVIGLALVCTIIILLIKKMDRKDFPAFYNEAA